MLGKYPDNPNESKKDPFVGTKKPVKVSDEQQGRLQRKVGITSPKGKFYFAYSVKWRVGNEDREKKFPHEDPWVIIF